MAAASDGYFGEGPKVFVAGTDRAGAQAAYDNLTRHQYHRDLMIVVDKALQARAAQGNPIKVAILGAGFMAQGLVNQIVNSVPGMRIVAIYSRKPQKAIHVLSYAGLTSPTEAVTQNQLEDAIRAGKPVF